MFFSFLVGKILSEFVGKPQSTIFFHYFIFLELFLDVTYSICYVGNKCSNIGKHKMFIKVKFNYLKKYKNKIPPNKRVTTTVKQKCLLSLNQDLIMKIIMKKYH